METYPLPIPYGHLDINDRTRMRKQMEERITGLKFTSDDSFGYMFSDLQKLISMKFDGVFFLKATKEASKKMNYSACKGSNKLIGWVIPKDKVTEFKQLFYEKRDISNWDAYKKSVWAWYDTERYHKWLFSFEGPIFGETIIE